MSSRHISSNLLTGLIRFGKAATAPVNTVIPVSDVPSIRLCTTQEMDIMTNF